MSWSDATFFHPSMEATWMSELKIFRPTAEEPVSECPETLPFDRTRNVISGRVSPRRMRALNRARLLFDNQCCAFCGKATVEPLELDDAVISRRNHRPIPGTATIVGFHCHSCQQEWPTYETVRA